jgi:hypothetical protein
MAPKTLKRVEREALPPRDCGVAAVLSELMYYRFNASSRSTFGRDLAQACQAGITHCTVESVRVAVRALGDMLGGRVSPRQPTSSMNADVSDSGLYVLRSDGWPNGRPGDVHAEALGRSLPKIAEHPRTRYVRQLGYGPVARTIATTLYRYMAGAR